ncbi:MAG: GGDEF domain-containing protein [Anaerolineales bacterium]|nr:GGDEF domain-containing protein [Anaerolineales bacterium]
MDAPLPAQDDDSLTGEELSEFKRTVLVENLRHFSALIVLSALLNVFVIIIERQAIGQFDAITWLRVVILLGVIAYLLLIGKPGRRPYRLQKSLFLGFASLGLLLTAMVAAQVMLTQGSTFIFIIAILLLSTFLILPLVEILGILAPSALYLAFAILRLAGGRLGIALASNLVNIASVTAFAILVAHLTYRARKQRFAYEVVIRRHNEFLRNIAALDGLTGVANRRKIDETVASIQAYATRDQISVAVLMFDLDNFKAYNDSCGHLAGDELLKDAAVAMKSVLRRHTDFFGRYGGEEFIAILPFTDAAGAERIAEEMRLAVCNLGVSHPGNPPGVATVSVGVAAAIPTHSAGLEAVIQLADQALYRIKRSGKNRVGI